MAGGSVSANVRYINTAWRDREDLPRIGSRDTRRANTSFHSVDVSDVRRELTSGEMGLDDAGFTLANLAADDVDFTDPENVRVLY